MHNKQQDLSEVEGKVLSLMYLEEMKDNSNLDNVNGKSGLDYKLFVKITKALQDKGYIEGVDFAMTGRGPRVAFLNNAKLTITGKEYIEKINN